MKKKSLIVATCVAMVLVLGLAGVGMTDPDDIAKGDITYNPNNLGMITFEGSGGTPFSGNFSITVPSGTAFQHGNDTPVCNVAVGIGVKNITKTNNADGSPILDNNGVETTLNIGLTSSLGLQILSAITINPTSHSFAPGDTFSPVSVTIVNPGVAEADYGWYVIKIKADPPLGFGLGEGSGTDILLKLLPAALSDNTPPDVNIVKPVNDPPYILGIIPVEVNATDPGPPGSGLNTLTATVKSAGSGLPEQAVTLTLDHVLPADPGVKVTGTGSFTPFGGTGTAGTTDALAFTSANRSGIGTYILKAHAEDVAGNETDSTVTFKVKYAIDWTKWAPSGRGSTNAQVQLTAKRSNSTSDGHLMYDHTVVMELLSGGVLLKSHPYGTGSSNDYVQIDPTTAVYLTNFQSLTSGTTYTIKLLFKDVDGNPMEQDSKTFTVPD